MYFDEFFLRDFWTSKTFKSVFFSKSYHWNLFLYYFTAFQTLSWHSNTLLYKTTLSKYFLNNFKAIGALEWQFIYNIILGPQTKGLKSLFFSFVYLWKKLYSEQKKRKGGWNNSEILDAVQGAGIYLCWPIWNIVAAATYYRNKKDINIQNKTITGFLCTV